MNNLDKALAAIAWLKSRYGAGDCCAVIQHDPGNPCGWSCDLSVPSTGITRSAVAATEGEAARNAAIELATALGWEPTP